MVKNMWKIMVWEEKNKMKNKNTYKESLRGVKDSENKNQWQITLDLMSRGKDLDLYKKIFIFSQD